MKTGGRPRAKPAQPTPKYDTIEDLRAGVHELREKLKRMRSHFEKMEEEYSTLEDEIYAIEKVVLQAMKDTGMDKDEIARPPSPLEQYFE